MLDFSFTDEQLAIRRSVRKFCEEQIAPRVREMDQAEKVPREIMKGLADLGVLGMTVSADYGGTQADPVTTGLVVEEIARADITCSLVGVFVAENAWGYLVDKYGTPHVKEEILPRITKGTIFMGIAATEPDVGTDLANLKTTARREGDSYVIDGEKMYISGIREIMEDTEEGGGFITLVKTAPDKGTRGISLVYTPIKGRPGVSLTYLKNMGRNALSHGGISFKGVKVPATFRIGEENRGFHTAMEAFDFARGIITVAVASAGLRALELGIDYIKQRTVFDVPLAKYQGIQFRLAEHHAKLEAIRLMGYRALWMYWKEQTEKKFTRHEVAKASAAAKMLGPVAAFEAVNDAMQWLGAYGYSKECPLEAALRGVRSYMLAEGAIEVMKVIVARELLGRDYLKKA